MFRQVNAFRTNATQIYFCGATYCHAKLMLHSLPSIKFIAEKTNINRQSLAEKSDRLKHFFLPSWHFLSCMFMKGTTVMQSSALRESKPSSDQLRAKFSVQSFQGDSEPFKLDTPPTYPPILVEATPVIIKNSQPAANSSKFECCSPQSTTPTRRPRQ